MFDLMRGRELAHYGSSRELVPESREQDARPERKPHGLWVSVEGGDAYGWREWGLENSFGCFDHRFSVNLAPDHNVLITNDLVSFHLAYAKALPSSDPDWRYELIDWAAVARHHQGIVIPIYQWHHRFDGIANHWYYGWDCASGCIWDAAAIASVTYDTEYEAPVDAPDMTEQEIPF